jgi:G:T/U-mismatch repair DNA glycosylase
VLLTGLEKKAPALGLDMRAAMEGKGYSVAKFCELLVDKATQRMETTDAFADWEDKSKGSQPLSDADRLRLNDLEKEVARLKKENERLLKAAKPNNPSTGASAVGNTGCFKCGKEGHRADQCPDNKPAPTKTAPATPKTSGAKSAGTSRKVSFSKLQLNTAVQEAVTKTVHETVAAMAKNGWQKP